MTATLALDCCDCGRHTMLTASTSKRAEYWARKDGWQKARDWVLGRWEWCCPACVAERKRTEEKKV